jgi:hypothetical protein
MLRSSLRRDEGLCGGAEAPGQRPHLSHHWFSIDLILILY